MRKIKIGIIVCALCVMLGGCGSKQEFENPGQFSYKGKMVSVGQTKEEVEKIIGADNEEIRVIYSTKRTEGEEVYVACNVNSKDVTTFGGIKVGDTKKKVQEKSPDCTEENNLLVVFFEGNEQVAEIEDKASESSYSITYTCGDDGKIENINLGDAKGVWMMK